MRYVRGVANVAAVVLALGSGGVQLVPDGTGWFSAGAVDARGWFQEVVWPGPWREPAALAAPETWRVGSSVDLPRNDISDQIEDSGYRYVVH